MWSVSINRHSPTAPFRFADLISLQEEVLAKVRTERGKALLFAELAPVITLGNRQMLAGAPPLESSRIGTAEVVGGERGGNETWHGPGQWVGFVLAPLLEFTGDSRGVRRAVRLILEAVLPVAELHVPDAKIEEGARLGIWSDAGKLCSVGIKIRDGYTSSGFALNCVPHPSAFLGLNPCGIADAAPDFLFRNRPQGFDFAGEFEKIPTLILDSFEKKTSATEF